MASHVSCHLVGHLGKDAALKYLQDEKAVLSFSVATSKKRKGKDGGLEESTTWWHCTWFGPRAIKVAEFLTKGRQVLVVGEVAAREYVSKDGRNATALDVEVRDLVLLGAGERAERADSVQPPSAPASQPRKAVESDEPPF